MQARTVIISGLVGLNAVLALPLISRNFHPASASAAPRAWAEYLTVPGNVAGGTDQVVLVVDMTHDELGAMNFDDTTHRLQVMNPIDLASIFRAADAMPPSSLRPPANPANVPPPAQPAPGAGRGG
jgi:hypothetical protein